MDRKKQLVEQCIAASNPPDDDMRNRTRLYFEAFTEEDLEKEFSALIGQMDLDDQKEATRREVVKLELAKVSGLANVQANDREIDKTFPVGTPFTVELFKSMVENNPEIRQRFIWQTQPFQRAKQAARARTEADREAFTQAMRELVASPSEANFSLVRGVLGSGFSAWDIRQAVANGSIQLLPANAEELAEYHQQAIAEHNSLLRTLAQKGDPKSMEALRRMARDEAAANQRYVPQQQAEFNLEAIRARDAQRGFPILPKSITKFQLQAATKEYTTTLVQKYGKYQLLSRLMEAGE